MPHRIIYINSNRWSRGSKKSKLSLKEYREYLINHEVFHALGGGHNLCTKKDKVCPISHQYTKGIPVGVKKTSWPLKWEHEQLNKLPEIY